MDWGAGDSHKIILGDTPADVTCGNSIGARAIGVATGDDRLVRALDTKAMSYGSGQDGGYLVCPHSHRHRVHPDPHEVHIEQLGSLREGRVARRPQHQGGSSRVVGVAGAPLRAGGLDR